MTDTIIITGSLGLIGHTTAEFFLLRGFTVVGIDNDFRGKTLNGPSRFNEKIEYFRKKYEDRYIHYSVDITLSKKITKIFKKYTNTISGVIHTAAQTSHDWAKNDPMLDFKVNAESTLQLLELTRSFCPDGVFIFTSTNKVYGDRVNTLSFKNSSMRYDLEKQHKYFDGIDESFSIDQSTHSLFGVSKTSADLLVQEYGRYFGLKTGTFRLGVVAGPGQSGTVHQGFLSYLMQHAVQDKPFTVIGYQGKQVRDIIHAKDVADAFYNFYQKPTSGCVYNLGGGRKNSASLLELQQSIFRLFNKKIKFQFYPTQRTGDHKWWISDTHTFKKSYPDWDITYSLNETLVDIYNDLNENTSYS